MIALETQRIKIKIHDKGLTIERKSTAASPLVVLNLDEEAATDLWKLFRLADEAANKNPEWVDA